MLLECQRMLPEFLAHYPQKNTGDLLFDKTKYIIYYSTIKVTRGSMKCIYFIEKL